MSGLIPYLEKILSPLPGSALLPTALGDDIFSDCTVVSNCTQVEVEKLKLSLKSIRQAIELMYGLYFTWFAMMQKRQAFHMLHRGEHAYRLAILTFFLYNCFVCLNGSTVNSLYNSIPPDLEEYLPLDEEIPPYVPFERTSNYKYDFYDFL